MRSPRGTQGYQAEVESCMETALPREDTGISEDKDVQEQGIDDPPSCVRSHLLYGMTSSVPKAWGSQAGNLCQSAPEHHQTPVFKRQPAA